MLKSTEQSKMAALPRINRFVLLYVLAQIGAFVAFVPLLQIIVPQRIISIASDDSARLLGTLTMIGAVAASAANLAAGALSDATPARLGRRRSWLIGGLLGVMLSYVLVGESRTEGSLILAVVCFQLFFNAFFAPLAALLAEHVPASQRGTVAALIGLGQPVGSVVGVAIAALPQVGLAARLSAVGALVALFVLPMAIALREAPAAEQRPLAPAPTGFAIAFLSRLCVVAALNLVQVYMLLFLVAAPGRGLQLPLTPAVALAQLVSISTVASIVAGLLTGRSSDRHGGRRWFVLGGAVLIGGATLAMPWAGSWTLLRATAVLWGCGSGMFYAADLALVAALLPSNRHAGGGFAIVNLANTLPQIALPMLAVHMLHGAVPDYRPLFAVAAGIAVIGGLLMLAIRRPMARPA